MSRVVNFRLGEADVLARCSSEQVGVSAIEPLPQGGVRLVCMSMAGADTMRRKLKSAIIKGDVVRARHRPSKPLW